MTDQSADSGVPRPPDNFWREVPCGHPDEPMAWRFNDGSFACHCGRSLDPSQGHDFEMGFPLTYCGKCGCMVGLPAHNDCSEP